MWRTEGLRGFYKGFLPGLLRDVPGTGAYFWAFQYLKNFFELDDLTGSKHSRKRQYLMLMWSGGVAGQISWLVAYPWEVIKTVI
jgi:solute carrier family 25 carnitine/acylcarnitine transporter 20/29